MLIIRYKSADGEVGGIPAQNADFIAAVYGSAWWIALIIVVVTFAFLARPCAGKWLL